MGQYTLFGALGSPYTLKMRAVLRYKRLPFILKHAIRGMQNPTHGSAEIAHVKPLVIPVLKDTEGRFHVDSTPMIGWLDVKHPQRAVSPADPVQRFLDLLLEDFADEWVTKLVFRYRWATQRDQQFCADFLVFDNGTKGRTNIERVAESFSERQIARMDFVGCADENAPVLESSFLELIDALNSIVIDQPFVFGQRPGRGDFALYGQLMELATDPTPSEIFRENAPFAWRWLSHMDDAGAVESPVDDAGSATRLHAGTVRLLALCGSLYLPFLRGNAEALSAGQETFETQWLGKVFKQAPFKYQLKCLRLLAAEYQDLNGNEQAQVKLYLGESAAQILAR